MADTSGPAYPTSKPLFSIDPDTGESVLVPGGQADIPGLTRRLWLAANAPPPPEGWVARKLKAHAERDELNRLQAKTRTPKPSLHDLDVGWRFDWADAMLAVADR